MALDEPSAQLHLDIRNEVQTALASRRPLIHHLNADTTWFLQLPRPHNEILHSGRVYYNILIDPWLAGGQSDVASWFSQQFHANPSAVRDIAALEELAREIEILAAALRLGGDKATNGTAAQNAEAPETFIDACLISHPFTDHCHKPTLMELDPNVPVFAIKEAAKLIYGWKHFKTVMTVDSFGADGVTDWRSTSLSPLPNWIGISRLLQKEDVLDYHAAIMIAFNNTRTHVATNATKKQGVNATRKRRHSSIKPEENREAAEAVVYTPHGIYSGDLHLIPNASPPIHTLAFLHGLHNVRVGTVSGRTALQSNLGAHNGLKAQRLLNAKYWISTHDEIKKGGGLVSWFLQRDVISVHEALEEERRARYEGKGGDGDGGVDVELVDAFEGTNWVELGNGESRVLL